MSVTAVKNPVYQSALDYLKRGWNVIPVDGKRPTLTGWKRWYQESVTIEWVNRWEGLWKGVAVICGNVSNNLAIVDLDGEEAVKLFYDRFPNYTETHTVLTGSGQGRHLYFHYENHTTNGRIKADFGGIELRADRCICVAPPSPHESGRHYELINDIDVKHVHSLREIRLWIEDLRHKDHKQAKQLSVATTPAAQSPASNHDAWAETALDNEVSRVRSAGKGERNQTLFDASLKLGSIIASGLLDRMTVEQSLMSATASNGLLNDDGHSQVTKTIASGIDTGLQNPRGPLQNLPKKNGNVTKAIEQSTAVAQSAAKPEDDNHPLPYRPDEEQIAAYCQTQLKGDFQYFRSSWHEYDCGVWKPIKSIDKQLTEVLKAVRMRGVKVTRNKVSGVDFFLQTYQELADDSVVDDYPQYINVKNGLFNLTTFQLETHRKDVYITAQANFEFDGSAKPTVFVNWLKSMLVKPDGSFDRELMMLVQEAMGYSLTSDTRHRISFWIKGPTHSGKSTLLKTLIMLMGSHHETLDLNQLGTNRFLLARIAGKRLVTFGENDAQTKLADGMYKMLVDNGGEITADIKNREPISFTPQCKVWWAMNNYPYVGDRSGAVHSRVMIIPFHRSIPQHDWDLDLIDKIKTELAGVFNFALKGLERLRANKRFTYVAQSEALKDELQRDTDVYSAFYDDEQWCSKTGQTEPMTLYKAFDVWCKENGVRNYASNVSIKREWLRIGMDYGRTGPKGRFYDGVSLTTYAKNKII